MHRYDFIVRVTASVAATAARQTVRAPAADAIASTMEAPASRHTESGKPIRLALIGTGETTPRHLKQAAASRRAHIVAACARTLESVKAHTVEFDIEPSFDDYRQILDTVNPDAVVVTTPHALHPEGRTQEVQTTFTPWHTIEPVFHDTRSRFV